MLPIILHCTRWDRKFRSWVEWYMPDPNCSQCCHVCKIVSMAKQAAILVSQVSSSRTDYEVRYTASTTRQIIALTILQSELSPYSHKRMIFTRSSVWIESLIITFFKAPYAESRRWQSAKRQWQSRWMRWGLFVFRTKPRKYAMCFDDRLTSFEYCKIFVYVAVDTVTGHPVIP